MKSKILPKQVVMICSFRRWGQKFMLLLTTLILLSQADAQNLKNLIPGKKGVTKHFTVLRENDKIPFTNKPKALLGLDDESDLVLAKAEQDKLGYVHYRYYQTYKGVPIENSVYIVQTKQNLIKKLSGKIITDFNPGMKTRSTSVIDAQKAFDIAVRYVAAEKYAWEDTAMEQDLKMQMGNKNASYKSKPVWVWVNTGDELDADGLTLAYKVDVYALQPLSRAYYFVDAQNGKVLNKKDILNFSDTTGYAVTVYSGIQTIHSDRLNNIYRLRDYSKGGGIITVHGESGRSGRDYNSGSPNWNFTGNDRAALDAHYGLAASYTFYKNNFDRNSYDNAGAPIKSHVNSWVAGPGNALWNGLVIHFGTYSGQPGGMTAIDIAGHELTHAVTQRTCDLNYSGESGAINESLSDIMGKSIQFYTKPSDINWGLGNDMNDVVRDMSNPNAYWQPDTYKGNNWYTGTNESFVVHTNSGVGNYFFYLLVSGGSGTNDNGTVYNVSGIGLSKADQIIYRTQTVYLTPTSNYEDWRTACINAATDLYGANSDEVSQVKNAWNAVGVGCPLPVVYVVTGGGAYCQYNSPGSEVGLSNSQKGFSYQLYRDGSFTGIQVEGTDSEISFGIQSVTGKYTVVGVNPGGDSTCSVTMAGNVRVIAVTPIILYQDADKDGYGYINARILSCNLIPGWVQNNTDCNDNDASVHAPKQYYVDADGDGYGSSTSATFCKSIPPAGYSANNTDCNDNDAAINPGTIWVIDNDNDNHTPQLYKQCESPGPGWFIRANQSIGDCDDSNPNIYSGAPELCDGIDNNCNEVIDEGVKTLYYRDADSDGFGDYSNNVYACSQPEGYITYGNDCDDTRETVHPGATEICGNGIDDNCNGQVDEKCTTVCGNATGLTVTNITSTSATIAWSASVDPVQWEIQYRKEGRNISWTTNTLRGSARALNISSLVANQMYNGRIRAKCGKTWTAYSDIISFRTVSAQQVSSQQSLTLKNVLQEKSAIIKLYPNPTKGRFIIELHLQDKITTTAKVELVNIVGQTVCIENANINNGILQKTFTISSSHTSGIYMVRVIANSKTYVSKIVYEK